MSANGGAGATTAKGDAVGPEDDGNELEDGLAAAAKADTISAPATAKGEEGGPKPGIDGGDAGSCSVKGRLVVEKGDAGKDPPLMAALGVTAEKGFRAGADPPEVKGEAAAAVCGDGMASKGFPGGGASPTEDDGGGIIGAEKSRMPFTRASGKVISTSSLGKGAR